MAEGRATLRLLGAWTAVIVLAVSPAVGEGTAALEIEGLSIPESLTGVPGNSTRGRQIVRDINNVTCLICHALPIPEEPDHGEIGPPLHGIGSRYSAGEIRLRIVDPKVVNPDSIMPSYYRTDGLYRVMRQYEGRTIYTAQQVEDVVAYLVSLKEE